MNLLLDMNLSPVWSEFFTEEGYEAKHWSTLGKGNAPDTDILSYAKTNDYVVLTFDLDFTDLLAASGENTPSVVILRTRTLKAEKLQMRLLEILKQCQEDLENGAVVIVEDTKTRVRTLPIEMKGKKEE
jgi:predicted nuclease of predicted toxin-antitoxin system